MNLSDGDTMVAAADNAGLKIAVSHQQVYQPATQKIKRMLDEGRIGQVHSIYTHGKQDNRGGGEDWMRDFVQRIQQEDKSGNNPGTGRCRNLCDV